MKKLFNGIFEKYIDEEEQWKDIYFYDDSREEMFDYRDSYEISTYGRVRNKKTDKILKHQNNTGGYCTVTLKYNRFLIHRLVAYMFIPNPQNKPYIDHIDTNRTNNHVNNLRWCTQKENINNPITKKKLKRNN